MSTEVGNVTLSVMHFAVLNLKSRFNSLRFWRQLPPKMVLKENGVVYLGKLQIRENWELFLNTVPTFYGFPVTHDRTMCSKTRLRCLKSKHTDGLNLQMPAL